MILSYLFIGLLTFAFMQRLVGFVNTELAVWSLFGWPVVWGRLAWEFLRA